MSSAQDIKINLLPPSEFEVSFWGRFLKWAITTGRYVIIVTELVVIVAFLSRFKLDSELASLTDEIRGKTNVLDAQASFETRFRGIQARIAAAESVINSSPEYGKEIDAISQTVPPGVKLSSLLIGKNADTIEASAVSSGDLGAMLGQMSQANKWKSVDVTGLVSDAIKGISLSLSLKR